VVNSTLTLLSHVYEMENIKLDSSNTAQSAF